MDVVVVATGGGLRVEARGSCIASVDTSQGIIDISTRQGGQRSFGVSRAGVDAAVVALENVCAWHRRVSGGVSGGAAGGGAAPDVRAALLAALRERARARVPAIERVERVVAAERATPFVFSRAMMRARYFVDDVLRFRAAAVVAARIEELPEASERVEVVDALVPKLERWRALFAPHGHVTRALDKTLTDVSDEMSSDDLWTLARVRLERPLQSALHLKILAERARAPASQHRREHLSMIQHAGHDELVELRSRVAAALQLEDLSEDEENHLLAEAIASGGARDGDERLGRLVQRSLVDGAPLRENQPSPSTQTARPPIAPPPGARHLRTAGAIVREGREMQHCVGAHAKSGVRGQSFVFHVEMDGEPVTVEVDVMGCVIDCAGRRNAKTPAVQRVRELFEKWGEGFPGHR